LAGDVSELMKSAIRIHQKTIAERKIQLLKDLQEELVMEGYSGELLQVFSNLIANTLDAPPVEGQPPASVQKAAKRGSLRHRRQRSRHPDGKPYENV
jgi:signal transduction histidine kinase